MNDGFENVHNIKQSSDDDNMIEVPTSSPVFHTSIVMDLTKIDPLEEICCIGKHKPLGIIQMADVIDFHQTGLMTINPDDNKTIGNHSFLNYAKNITQWKGGSSRLSVRKRVSNTTKQPAKNHHYIEKDRHPIIVVTRFLDMEKLKIFRRHVLNLDMTYNKQISSQIRLINLCECSPNVMSGFCFDEDCAKRFFDTRRIGSVGVLRHLKQLLSKEVIYCDGSIVGFKSISMLLESMNRSNCCMGTLMQPIRLEDILKSKSCLDKENREVECLALNDYLYALRDDFTVLSAINMKDENDIVWKLNPENTFNKIPDGKYTHLFHETHETNESNNNNCDDVFMMHVGFAGVAYIKESVVDYFLRPFNRNDVNSYLNQEHDNNANNVHMKHKKMTKDDSHDEKNSFELSESQKYFCRIAALSEASMIQRVHKLCQEEFDPTGTRNNEENSFMSSNSSCMQSKLRDVIEKNETTESSNLPLSCREDPKKKNDPNNKGEPQDKSKNKDTPDLLWSKLSSFINFDELEIMNLISLLASGQSHKSAINWGLSKIKEDNGFYHPDVYLQKLNESAPMEGLGGDLGDGSYAMGTRIFTAISPDNDRVTMWNLGNYKGKNGIGNRLNEELIKLVSQEEERRERKLQYNDRLLPAFLYNAIVKPNQ